MTTQTHAWYQLARVYGEHTHEEIVLQSPSYELVKEEFDSIVKQTLKEEDSDTDSLEIEKINVTIDEYGDVDEVSDNETLAEQIFNPYPED